MNDNIKIYLAGTIYDNEPASSWKKRFIESLCDNNIEYEIFDPAPQDECDLTMVARDKAAINKSDVFVAYIEKTTVGTSMELYHAFLQNNIPIIVICPNRIVEGNIWIEAHSHVIVSNVEDAVKQIGNLTF